MEGWKDLIINSDGTQTPGLKTFLRNPRLTSQSPQLYFHIVHRTEKLVSRIRTVKLAWANVAEQKRAPTTEAQTASTQIQRKRPVHTVWLTGDDWEVTGKRWRQNEKKNSKKTNSIFFFRLAYLHVKLFKSQPAGQIVWEGRGEENRTGERRGK